TLERFEWGLENVPVGESGDAARVAELAPVRAEAESCRKCGLCETRNHVVFGEGSVDADIMFVGEAPGKDEDEQGRPFVGRAGRLLTKMIEGGMKRPRSSVYICNIIKCRPPGNRDPRPEETDACINYIKIQLRIIRPKVIVCLGRISGRILTGEDLTMGKLRGRWFEYEGIPMRCIYHPAYLLRQRGASGKKTDADMRTWQDMQEIIKRIDA
ncbi:MAG: uracil-DNA glycosylase, partial [Planctomycetes bacterium]|nr:uracil-DNA glycosylase [Planctomycetota bacterium]